jgi:uncharacterized membrane protein
MTRVLAYVAAHRKALIAYAAVVVTVLAVALPHTSPWYAVIITLAGALGVHAVPNKPARGAAGILRR